MVGPIVYIFDINATTMQRNRLAPSALAINIYSVRPQIAYNNLS